MARWRVRLYIRIIEKGEADVVLFFMCLTTPLSVTYVMQSGDEHLILQTCGHVASCLCHTKSSLLRVAISRARQPRLSEQRLPPTSFVGAQQQSM